MALSFNETVLQMPVKAWELWARWLATWLHVSLTPGQYTVSFSKMVLQGQAGKYPAALIITEINQMCTLSSERGADKGIWW